MPRLRNAKRRVSETILSLPLIEQVPALIDLMHAYLDEYRGRCPFFGRVRGFRFVRQNESLSFTTVGSYAGRDHEPFRRPHAELVIGEKTVDSPFK